MSVTRSSWSAFERSTHVGRGRTATLLAYVCICIAFFVAATLSLPALQSIQRHIGDTRQVSIAEAFFPSPEAVDQGVHRGEILHVVVVPGSSRSSIRWSARSGPSIVDSGTVVVRTGASHTILVHTFRSRSEAWLVITLSDIRTPLRVWVK